MGFEVSQQSAGLVNSYQGKKTNLFDKAVELAKDGELSAADLQKLTGESTADGTQTAEEKLFLQGLNNKDDRSRFVSAARTAEFDPQGFTFEVNSKLVVPVEGKQVEIEFASDPPVGKRVTGDRDEALETIKDQLPPGLRDRWDKNVYNLAEMKKLFAEMSKGDAKSNPNFRTPFQRMELMQAYLTANYNHPGVDINWQGASIQGGINAMPKDAQGRKYVDCEAYSQIAEEILGKDKVQHFDVSSGAHADGRRDHQVSVVRDPANPDNAYVISNNSVKRVSAKFDDGSPKPPERLITEAHPEFSRPIHDDNGPMKFNTNNYVDGMELPAFGDTKATVVRALPNQSAMDGLFDNPITGDKYHVVLRIDQATGVLKPKITPQQGDVLYADANNGQRYKFVVGNRPPMATQTTLDASGSEVPNSQKQAQLQSLEDGSFNFRTLP